MIAEPISISSLPVCLYCVTRTCYSLYATSVSSPDRVLNEVFSKTYFLLVHMEHRKLHPIVSVPGIMYCCFLFLHDFTTYDIKFVA